MIGESVAGLRQFGQGESLAQSQRNEGGGHVAHRHGRHARGWCLPRNRRCGAWGTAGVGKVESHRTWLDCSHASFYVWQPALFKELIRRFFPLPSSTKLRQPIIRSGSFKSQEVETGCGVSWFTRLHRKPQLPVLRSSLLRRMDQAVEECAASVLRPGGQSLWAACRSLGEGGHASVGFVPAVFLAVTV